MARRVVARSAGAVEARTLESLTGVVDGRPARTVRLSLVAGVVALLLPGVLLPAWAGHGSPGMGRVPTVRPYGPSVHGPWEELPVVPRIGAAMQTRLRGVFLAGQLAGNRAGVFAKVGDSITASPFFLIGIGCAGEDLGSHRALEPVIRSFRLVPVPPGTAPAPCGLDNSFTRWSVAAGVGWTADRVLAPLQPPNERCGRPFDTPLRCELHVLRPSVAIVMFGTNDVSHDADPDRFRRSLSEIVLESVDAGVIPILSTVPARLDDPQAGARVPLFNSIVAEVAADEQVPLINLWKALDAAGMVNRGISSDGAHPNQSGPCAPRCMPSAFTAHGLRYGYNQRNFTAIEALAKVKAIVMEDGSPDADMESTAPPQARC
jgi:hypothetical protein